MGGHDGGDDLAHLAGRGGAHFGDGGIDEGGQFFFGQGLGQIALDDGQFGGFLVGQILTAGGGILLDGVLTLLAFLDDEVEHLGIVQGAAGTAQVHQTVLDGGLEQAQDGQTHGVLGLVGLDVIFFDSFKQAHGVGMGRG